MAFADVCLHASPGEASVVLCWLEQVVGFDMGYVGKTG